MKNRWTLLALFLVCLAWATPSLAYLDPGSGSMLLQLLLGGVAGLIVILKLYWRRLLGLFGVKRPADDTEGEKPAP